MGGVNVKLAGVLILSGPQLVMGADETEEYDSFEATADKLTTVSNEAYALTRTGMDLLVRGMMRSLSKDPEECHSCIRAYK